MFSKSHPCLNIHHDDSDIGLRGGLVRSKHTFLLNHVIRLSQAGCIADDDWISSDIHRHLNDIARRAGNSRHDGGWAASENVKKAALPGVRRTENRNLNAAAQHFTATIICQVSPNSTSKILDSTQVLAPQQVLQSSDRSKRTD